MLGCNVDDLVMDLRSFASMALLSRGIWSYAKLCGEGRVYPPALGRPCLFSKKKEVGN